ncbi:hypothetical protein BRADI_5g07705v3 [Brachypodium distachyon]|uniref:Knottin scorpion toxin-like domain-containing protein n=1 Tax=Brachypodium distachyon TaxID=15368 RepID=A0A2K2CFU1_BRADI|nr:hypothetical protein BRADI_5g07705v3 [Brachypodium distachyon]
MTAIRKMVLILFLVVSFALAVHGRRIEDEQSAASKGHEWPGSSDGARGGGLGAPSPAGGGGGLALASSPFVAPMGNCTETRIYTIPLCIDAFCSSTCMMSFHPGGHCRGNGFIRSCYCFMCD